MREIRQTNIFKRDLKKLSGRSKNLVKLYEIVENLPPTKNSKLVTDPTNLLANI